jgi:Type II CAAX prenyl endopeptidase Rce1-like
MQHTGMSYTTGVGKQLWTFAFNPSDQSLTVTNLARLLSSLFGYYILVKLVSVFMVVPLAASIGVSNANTAAIRSAEWHRLLLIMAIAAPIVEEIAFRLPLRISPTNFALSCSFVTLGWFSRWFLYQVGLGFLRTNVFEWWLWRGSVALFAGLACFGVMHIDRINKFARTIWSSHFKYVVYGSCLCFGLAHLENIRFSTPAATAMLVAPLLTVPQILAGLILSFTRVRLGIIWSIVLHSANNLLLVAFATLRFSEAF